MMEIAKEWVKNIFIIIAVLSFIEIIIPSSNMKNYIKFIFSLMILGIILSPLSQMQINPDFLEQYEIVADQTAFSNTMTSNGSNIQNLQSTQIEQAYKSKVREEIKILLESEITGIRIGTIDIHISNDVNSKDFGNIQYIVVTSDKPEETKRIKALIAEKFQLDKSIISNTEG